MTTHVLAMGGGGFSMDAEPGGLDELALELTGVPRPAVCFVPTASGDAEAYIERFLAAFGQLSCTPSVLRLFVRDQPDLDAFLADQDVVYVGGGSTANLLAVWRTHGLDVALRRRAATRDLVACGLSAGGLCWFEGGITDSWGPELAPLTDGLGWAAGSFCPHYDGEAGRRPSYRAAVGSGVLAAGWAADDGAAVHLVDGRVDELVTERGAAAVYRLEAVAGSASERRCDVRRL